VEPPAVRVRVGRERRGSGRSRGRRGGVGEAVAVAVVVVVRSGGHGEHGRGVARGREKRRERRGRKEAERGRRDEEELRTGEKVGFLKSGKGEFLSHPFPAGTLFPNSGLEFLGCGGFVLCCAARVIGTSMWRWRAASASPPGGCGGFGGNGRRRHHVFSRVSVSSSRRHKSPCAFYLHDPSTILNERYMFQRNFFKFFLSNLNFELRILDQPYALDLDRMAEKVKLHRDFSNPRHRRMGPSPSSFCLFLFENSIDLLIITNHHRKKYKNKKLQINH
jgi:hypothetical protein